MTFWIVTGGLTLLAALLIGRSLLGTRAETEAAERPDIGIYRDQLKAVEKDLARDVVSAEEAERLRTEIKRRILDADRAGGTGTREAPRWLSRAVAALAGLGIILGAYGLYDLLGAPGYADQPLSKRHADAAAMRAARPSQEEFEAQMPSSPPQEIDEDYANLMRQLREAVKTNPDELRGWELLARNEGRLGNLVTAHAAQRRVIELKGSNADAEDYLTYAGLLIQAAGGAVSTEADWALNGVLALEPSNPVARYYAGLMHLQTGRPDQTFAFWEPLLRAGPADAPWIPIIRARIEGVATLAGIRYTPPPTPASPHPEFAPAGPSAADMDAAAEMAPEDRQAMIQGMVDQLGERLASEGGPPQDWARMISSLGVLGDRERAAAIWAEAQTRFTDPDHLSIVRDAARALGLTE
ncbi:MAG: c-type cytochrome biogenesis protein CcmI [Tropicimonas sp.]|uniref:c-type cytochrome biogenesis protein CcmI n=1 Tax=Tropicimonas sp. TaxID=2067044 RepID=UPI003A846A8D